MRMILCLSVALAMAAFAGADWPSFGGPNGNDAVADVAPLARTWGDDGPPVLWQAKLGRGYGAASIRDGKAYLLDRERNQSDVLRCWDLDTGRELWRFAYDAPGRLGHGGSRSQPAVDERFVFTVGPFGHAYCIDLVTHKPVWSQDLLEEYGAKRPHWGVSQTPLLYKDWVLLAPLGREAGLVALEKSTGREIWRSEPLGKMEYASPVAAEIDGVETIVILSNKGRISGLDASTGKTLWRYDGWKCNIPIPTPLYLGEGRFFQTGGYGAGCAMFRVQRRQDAWTVTELWKAKAPGSIIHNAVPWQGRLYVKHNNKRTAKGLRCLSFEGDTLWSRGEGARYDFGHLLIADGLIFCLDGKTGVLRLLDAEADDYSALDETRVFEGGQEIWSPMALSDGKLLLRDQKGTLICLDVSAQ